MFRTRFYCALPIGLFALLLLSVETAYAVEGDATDCPAAFRPYSTAGTPLLDLMLNPAAKAVVDKDAPGFLAGLPPMLTGTTPPTLADILTIRNLTSEFIPMPDATLQKLDSDLAKVTPSHADAVARCARYDHGPPQLPAELKHPAILVFSKSNGFKDVPSVNGAEAALKGMAVQDHWDLVFSDNAAVFNSTQLKRFDAVVWNNVSGDVLTDSQRRDFKSYMENGGGFVGLHGSGGDFFYDWNWYPDKLLGAQFLSHPMSPQFQAAKLKVDDTQDAIVKGLQVNGR